MGLSIRIGVELVVAIIFYAIGTVLGCTFVGVIIFKEHLSIMNGIGIILSLISLILINLR